MPTGSLPSEGKKLWEKVYNASKAKGDSVKKAAKKAWGAVKNAGWHKDKSGKWVKKADLVEFSLVITKASFDKTTGERRWLATASDTELDSFGDKMSMGLFSDFCDRIKSNEEAPEDFRSEFWSGGMPYLSVSHYPDLDGDAVPGVIDDVFIDGSKFKSKGRFSDNPLGIASYNSVKKDIVEKSPDPVRISIAFLDYKHRHLSNDFVFERSLDDPDKMICPECIKEMITGDYGGKEFLRGMLIHEAMTRVPVNKRTGMEVDRSMTTRKEDAASIIGDELAEEIEKKAKMVGKSEALVIKSDDEEVEQTIEEIMDETEPEEVDVVEDMKEEITENVSEYDKVFSELSELRSEISELISLMKGKKDKPKEDEEDEEDSSEDEAEDKKKKMKSEVDEVDYVEAFRSALSDTNQRLDILISAFSQNTTATGVPQRRSFTPPPNYAPPAIQQPVNPHTPQSIGDFVRKSVG